MIRSLYTSLIIAIVLFSNFSAFSQGVAINSTGGSSHPSSILDIKCKDQGILLPRMSSVERNAVIDPAEGLLIYNTTSNTFNVFDGNSWVNIPSTFVTSTSGALSPGGGIALNHTGADPHGSAKLDISSSSKGVLLPRTLLDSIASPPDGIMIYNTSTRLISYYNGWIWTTPCIQDIAVTPASGSTESDGIAINTDGSMVDNSAILDISSDNKGFLIPRLNDAQRNNMLPTTGLLIYNTDANIPQYWNGIAWYSLTSTGEGFITEWRTSALGESITLPLYNAPDCSFQFIIDWGDGSTDTITSYDDPDRIHNYSLPGDYKTQIVGICEAWRFQDAGNRLKLINILSWGDQCKFSGFKYLEHGFEDCTNLKTLASGSILASDDGCENFSSTFRNCSSLIGIPAGLFDNHTAVIANAFSYTFAGCTAIISIPGGLFDNQTQASTAAFSHTFFGCTALRTIPEEIFHKNTFVSGWAFNGTFRDCSSITTLPPGLFNKNILVSSSGFKSTFKGCSSLASVYDDLFDNSWFVSSYGFDSTFYGCSSLASIPAGLFDFNTNLSTYAFRNTFTNCTSLTAIPSGLFDNNTGISISAFEGTFKGCTSITAIPSGLFDNNTAASQNGFKATFQDCSSISAIPNGLFHNNTQLSSGGFMETFSGCSSLTLIPAESFDNCSLLSSYAFYATFKDCISLTAIPTALFDGNTLVSGYAFFATFEGCSSLTSIPAFLFDNNPLVSMYAFCRTFYGCSGITSIPSGLFDNNTAVSLCGFEFVFGSCSALTAIPSGLFDNNTQVSYSGFRGAFRSCTSLTAIPAGLFDNNTALTVNAFHSTFEDCSSLLVIPSGLFDNNTLASDGAFNRTFFECDALTTVPVYLFRYNTAVTTHGFVQTFNNCENLVINRNIFFADGEENTRFLNQSVSFFQCFFRSAYGGGSIGEAPPLWNCDFGTGTANSTGTYGGTGNTTSSLSNYGSIPAGWK